ncbi:hypothetical protein M0812_14941 [Anaeramoeba flamelloides]|uniref:Glycosyltransferase n=1 Tax=Anaeramoeba flamelloides TaxID=1746091 RepID=A0AAV7ZDC2_9EUKA|nr:hypothetical protein M0812_14941 [Anaeramoeba flamelloides]
MAIIFILGFFLIVLFITNQKEKNKECDYSSLNLNVLNEMRKEFWKNEELSWVPNYLRDRELGSSVLELPNKFLKKDNTNTLQKQDNIGGRYYKKTQGYPPIDAVIMWVNGSDTIFQKEKQNEYFKYDNCEKNCPYLIETKMSWCCPTRNKKENKVRFTEHHELKYLLRQIERFAPWIRRIYLVTNNQIPNWLDLSNERIQIAVPSEFVKYPESLPTFSSPALESQIHRIKGLSRLFLYFNDDFFITKPIWPSDFITQDNQYKLRTAWHIAKSDLKIYQRNPLQKTLSKPDNIYTESVKYTDTIFDLTFGKGNRKVAPHAPMIIDREIMERIWKEWPNEMEQTARSKFRLGNQMHYQTTFLIYVQNSWINLNFCNFFSLSFDNDHDKLFNYQEIKKISYQISELFNKDTHDLFSIIIDQIQSIRKVLYDESDISKNNYRQDDSRYNNYPNNANAHEHDSEYPILDLKVDCEILEKIPLIVEYYKKIMKKNKSKLKLYKSIGLQTEDHYFTMIRRIKDLKKAFDKINEQENIHFISFNDDFGYRRKSQLIKFDKEFHRLANEHWPNKSQFELPENKLNKNLRVKYS